GPEQGLHALAERRAHRRTRLPRGDAGRGHPLLVAQPAHPPGRGRMTAGPTPAPVLAPAGAPTEARIAPREALAQPARSKTVLIGLVVVGWWVFWAIVGSRLTPHDPLGQNYDILKAPRSGNWLGTDQLGRDVFSRVLAGASDTLQVAPLGALLGVAGGTVIGLIGGYF